MLHFSFLSKLQAACSADLVIHISASGVSKQPDKKERKPFLVGKSRQARTHACGEAAVGMQLRQSCHATFPAMAWVQLERPRWLWVRSKHKGGSMAGPS